ncbi:MAG: ribbon-helix-helix protein, CopG family [Hyphomicrobiales bacterium]|nr:MAG: ribbon-helix-helix protein, CopG family [Hyphomicrobiales bacterium]
MDITIEVEAGLAASLSNPAADMGRSPGWVIARAIEDYVALNVSQVAQIKEGIAQADRGEFATDAEIEAILKNLEDLVRRS